MITAVAWAKQQELVLENDETKLVWNFEFYLRKSTTARIPNLVLKLKKKKKKIRTKSKKKKKKKLRQREQRR